MRKYTFLYTGCFTKSVDIFKYLDISRFKMRLSANANSVDKSQAVYKIEKFDPTINTYLMSNKYLKISTLFGETPFIKA